MDHLEKILYFLKGSRQFKRFLHPGVSNIRYGAKFIGIDPCSLVDHPHQGRLIPDFPWSVPGAGPIGDSPVKGDADKGDVQSFHIFPIRGPHECRKTGIARALLRIFKFRIVTHFIFLRLSWTSKENTTLSRV